MIPNSIKNAMQVVYERFFNKETEQFYDFVIDDENNAWFHLPTPEDINSLNPNPLGWGTGMEDSALNGGTALDALILLHNIKSDVKLKDFIYAVARGLMRCNTFCKDKGFIARSISPFDKKSHYAESSRDQYTQWIYGMIKFYDSDLCTLLFKNEIRKTVVNIAQKCKHDVKQRNGYHLLREDGKIGIAGKMWHDLSYHEWARLPMFYLAAYHVTGDNEWEDMYLKYRDEAIENSKGHNPKNARCYATLQMQCSLRFIYDYDNDVSVKEKVKDIMIKNATYGVKKAIDNSNEYCKVTHNDELYYRFKKWNKVDFPMELKGIYDGKGYINPAQSESKLNSAFYPVREIAEGALIATTCPDFKIEDNLLKAVEIMADVIDFKKYSNIYAPLYLSCAYFCIKEKQLDS